jgi:Transglutaminase-like superfamily
MRRRPCLASLLSNFGFTPVQRYLLARHVFTCMSGDQAILLDLRSDQYLALDVDASRHLSEAVVGWPPALAEQRDSQQGVDATVQQLLQRDLVTLDPRKGKPAVAVAAPSPTKTLLTPAKFLDEAGRGSRPLQISSVVAVLVAAVRARIWLRLRGIEWIVNKVSRRAGRAPLDEDMARELVALFYDSQPFVFSARSACIFDSLSLLLFLRRSGSFPQWIFGIRTGPFAAHCWLQSDDIVLNDTVEHVRSYTPIMSV